MTASVAIVMGSDSDYPIMSKAQEILRFLEVETMTTVLSAHRTPHDMLEFGTSAQSVGYKILIAGAGGAAHLPGMLASVTTLPVIGVPVKLSTLEGLDSLLSIVQMPSGVPVATIGINNATNAGLLAARMLALSDPALSQRLNDYRRELERTSRSKTLPSPGADLHL
jgi:phosphoribosylaminoimidazole carboxylase PurE protein